MCVRVYVYVCVCVSVCVCFLETTAKNALRTLHCIPFLSEKLAHILNIHMRRYIEYTYAYKFSCTLIYTYILSITHTHWRITAYPVSTSLCVAEFTGSICIPKFGGSLNHLRHCMRKLADPECAVDVSRT